MLTLYGQSFDSHLLIGTASYPSLQVMLDAIELSGAQIITVSLRRQLQGDVCANPFWNSIKTLGCQLLPNTAGCHSMQEAVTTAEMAREIFDTDWIKLEVIGDDYQLQPNVFELLKGAEELIKRGFKVFPYCTDDLLVCQRLWELGCQVLMPWAAPIGSGLGMINPYGLKTLRARLPNASLIVDAGIGRPSDAVQVMELGYDGVLLNSAVALASDAVTMASAFKAAVVAGRLAHESGCIPRREQARPSTPLLDTPFWQQS